MAIAFLGGDAIAFAVFMLEILYPFPQPRSIELGAIALFHFKSNILYLNRA
ncbi:hypothetical protein [Nostoc sp. FACHB-280]|uniref:hypothetical protein n=1 Tax=Nostoc sp. FACHB-280 TaxID=2692839 RepID=UPI00168AEB6F|nr:hypothetical protein [Nostoc sp. FACHB-280]MBD2495489.1 hypothetical protein [Nostoc sp. FACHB-280]